MHVFRISTELVDVIVRWQKTGSVKEIEVSLTDHWYAGQMAEYISNGTKKFVPVKSVLDHSRNYVTFSIPADATQYSVDMTDMRDTFSLSVRKEGFQFLRKP